MADISEKELVEMLYADIGKLMWAMVWDIANEDRWQLNADEVYGELCMELTHVVNKYHKKPYSQLKALAVTSIRNRIKDIKKALWLTYRKDEEFALSLEDISSVPGVVTEWFDLEGLLNSLSDDGKKLVFEVLYPSASTMRQILISAQRKKSVSKRDAWSVSPNKLILRRSLGWTSSKLEIAWAEVSTALASI